MHHLTRTDGAITGITTPGNVQERSGIHVKLVNGSEGKDVQKVLPAMCQLGRLGLDYADRSNELGGVGNRCAGMVLIEPTERPKCYGPYG